MSWLNLPQELRQLGQWVAASSNGAPVNPRTGAFASVTDPSTWGTFDEAIKSGYQHIGFVLAPWDPYSIIDLDNKINRPATEEQLERHRQILETFKSYTEKSRSGRGYHIIVRGKIPGGAKRDNVELYSYGHHLICTGDVIRQAPIVDYQELLERMWAEMKTSERIDLVELDETLDDRDLVEMAMRADNAEKFNRLCRGEWENDYPSQSEADFALLSMFAFYSRSNEQVRRLFRMSTLGKRDKAIKNDKYINYALEKIRAKQPAPVDFTKLIQRTEQLIFAPKPIPTAVPTPSSPQSPQFPELPPGLIGEIAQYFFQSAVRPVPDIALAAAIAIVSGVAGRSYNISGTGLNQYLILVAKTGSGKEGAVSGIDSLIAATKPKIPMVDRFIGPSAFASGQAMIKVLDDKPCFVSVLGEFGLTLQQLCDQNANSAQIMLRKVLLDLYSKSGWNKVLRSSVYSDVDKNTAEVHAPNVTLLGETTPETFFENLDSGHISEGLIPRFTVIQYDGDRPPRNQYANFPPPTELVDKFTEIVTIALTTEQNGTCQPVSTEGDAQKLLDDYDKEADHELNASRNDAETQIWNRAHLKALKLSALIAVGVNPHNPIITKPIAEWAIDFIRRDVGLMVKRFKTGDIGRGDSKLSADLRRVISTYFTTQKETLLNYGVDERMFKDKVIPYVFLVRKTAALAAFKKDKRGSNGALKAAITELCESGLIEEVPVNQLQSRYQSRAKAWVIGPRWKED